MKDHSIHKKDRIPFITEILFFLSIAILIFLSEYYQKWVFDDSFMFIRYARNLLDGKGYVWNPGGPRIDGLTSPLWLLVVLYSLKVFHVAPASYEFMLYFLSFISAMLLVIILYYTIKRLVPVSSRFLTALFTIIIFISPFDLPFHSSSGMETNLAAALLSLFLFYMIEMLETRVSLLQSLSLGILGFSCILARPELALIALLSPFLLWLKLHKDRSKAREILFVLFTTLGLSLVYGLFRLIYFRDIFPNAFYVKGSLWFTPYKDFNLNERTRLLHIPVFYFREGLIWHLIVFFGLLHKRNFKNLFWLWGPLYLSLLYISSTLQIMGYSYRYFFPFCGAIIYLIVLSWREALEGLSVLRSEQTRLPAWIFPLTVFLSLLILGFGHLDLYFKYRKENKDKKDFILEYYSKLSPGTSIAATEVGRLSAYNPHLIIHDLSGLNDPEFRHGFVADDLFMRHPDIITFIHEHYEGMTDQIINHPDFAHYLRAVNMLPETSKISLGTGIFVNADSPRAKEILEVMKKEENLIKMMSSQGGRVGFSFRHFPLILNNWGYHPLLGALLGSRDTEICAEFLKVDVGDPFSLYLGSGWYSPETWKNLGSVRAMEGSCGVLFLPMDSPSTTTVSISFYPYQYILSPSLKVNLVCNNFDLFEEYQAHQGYNHHEWTIPGHILRKGINELILVPNHTMSPLENDPESQDPRQLSIWLRSLEYSFKGD